MEKIDYYPSYEIPNALRSKFSDMEKYHSLEQLLRDVEEVDPFQKLRELGYEPERKLNEGNTRESWLVTRRTTGKQMVAKIPKLEPNPNSLTTLINMARGNLNKKEVEACKEVQNPLIAQFFESIDLEDGRTINIEGYHQGIDLESTIRGSGALFNDEEIRDVYGRVLDAVVDLNMNYGILHRDIKPSNILKTKRSIVITDLQNAGSLDDIAESPLPTRGGTQYSHIDLINALATGRKASASLRTEAHALGATLYYLITGTDAFNYRLEIDPQGRKEIALKINKKSRKEDVTVRYNLLDGKEIVDEISGERHEANLKKALAKLPKGVKKYEEFLYRAMTTNEDKAFKNAREMNEYFKEIDSGFKSKIKDAFVKSIKWALPLAVVGGLVCAAARYEPKELTLPAPRVQGDLYLPGKADEKPIEFTREEISDLKKPGEMIGLVAFDESMIKRATDNRVAACLLKSYHQAMRSNGIMLVEPVTDAQHDMWLAYCPDKSGDFRLHGPPAYSHVAKSIEVALSKSQTPDGKVDLEDTLAVARLGEDRVNEARRASGSFDFKNYIEAKRLDGKEIIPKREKIFLKEWLAYTVKNYFTYDENKSEIAKK